MKWSKGQIDYLKKNWGSTPKEEIQAKFPDKSWNSIQHKACRLKIERKIQEVKPVENGIKRDIKVSSLEIENKRLKSKYEQALEEIKQRDKIIETFETPYITTSEITINPKSNAGEAAAIVIASDWHVDEIVKPETVSNMNEYNPIIAKKRAENFFKNTLSVYNIQKTAIKIPTIVLALLGDFISNTIHEDSAENLSMLPMDAVMFAQNLIASGIEFLLKNTDASIIIPCHSGNHARITNKLHISSESSNSLEYYMYHQLAKYFRAEDRVKFIIPKSYTSTINIYNRIIRLHHGHGLQYYGGVGGLEIPANKAIANWNDTKRADLDIFGHWHFFKDNGNFVCNGSLMGYNSYALFKKFRYQPPKQAFFLLDKKRGKTVVCPILPSI